MGNSKGKGWFKEPGKHALAARGVKTASGKSEMEAILQHELEEEIEDRDEDIELTEEEEEKIEEELERTEQMHKDYAEKRKEVDDVKEYAELLAEELREAFDLSEKDVYVEDAPERDDMYSIYGHGLPYNWAIEMPGVENYMGIKGYHDDDDDFFLEPRTSNVLDVTPEGG